MVNDMKLMITKRVAYLFATLILLGIEIMIALFVHDKFVRPYVGDMLVVMVLYTFIRIFLPERMRLLPFYIFVFSALVELLQYIQIVKLLGLENNRFFAILIGSTFDIKDILCYGIGCLLLGGYELIIFRRNSLKKTATRAMIEKEN